MQFQLADIDFPSELKGFCLWREVGREFLKKSQCKNDWNPLTKQK